MEFDQDVQMEDVVEDVSLNLKEQEGPDQQGNLPRTILGELPAKSLDQLDAWIEKLSQCTPLAEEDVESLCNMVSAITFFYCYSPAFWY
jgi:serine/threonine-protein phosphatase 2A catalytic subunit